MPFTRVRRCHADAPSRLLKYSPHKLRKPGGSLFHNPVPGRHGIGFFRRFYAHFRLHDCDDCNCGRICPCECMRTRLKAAMLSTNI